MTDLVLIQGLPGGPYRLDITQTADRRRWFVASEMCLCDTAEGPHWHEATGAVSLPDLYTQLLERFLSGAQL